MGLKTGQTLVTELVRRLANLDRPTALAALNRAQNWCLRQGTFQFMMTTPISIAITLQAAPAQAATASSANLNNLDVGKAKMVLNTDGTPIQHVPWSDFWQSMNYNLPSGLTTYDCYTVQSFNSAAAGSGTANTFYFLPNITGSAVIYGHRFASPLVDNVTSSLEMPNDFDDLVVDLAEAEERRIYDIGDTWQLLLARSQDQIKVLLDGYRSSTLQPTGLQDAQTKVQEATALGRA